MITTNTASPSQAGTPAYMPPDNQMDPSADPSATGRMLFELIAGDNDSTSPKRPPSARSSDSNWDMDGIDAVDRYSIGAQMLETLEACRRLPFQALFADLGGIERAAASRMRSPWVPLGVAAISVLPWVLAVVIILVVAIKLL